VFQSFYYYIMLFCHFFLFSDHCAILELGYLKYGKIAYPEMVRPSAIRINDLLLYINKHTEALFYNNNNNNNINIVKNRTIIRKCSKVQNICNDSRKAKLYSRRN
jgi:hypothetical protein